MYLYRNYSNKTQITYDHVCKRLYVKHDNKHNNKHIIKEFSLLYTESHYGKRQQITVEDNVLKKELVIVNLIKRRVANKQLDKFIAQHFLLPQFRTRIYINGEIRETL